MKSFLILQFRPNDKASNNEFEAILRWSNLEKNQVKRVRVEQGYFPEIQLDNYAAIIMGGSPFNVSDPKDMKSISQQKSEKFVFSLMRRVMQNDFPCLGICYGLGVLGQCCNGIVSQEKYSEKVSAITIHLTEEGRNDPISKNIPNFFKAIVGHKEACQATPTGTVLLASSDTCPTQLIRYKKNIYATQFHPELDDKGIAMRANVYKDAGYFPPDEVQVIIDRTSGYDLSNAAKILENFVLLYR